MMIVAICKLQFITIQMRAWSWLLMLVSIEMLGQSVGTHLPDKISRKARYVFYLHGGVVTVRGDMAINESVPEWGPYEYSRILDSLKARRVHVISEIRKEKVSDSVYVQKIAAQIDSLLKRRVPAQNILVLGASAGNNIALGVSDKMKNPKLRFVHMGGCWPDTWKDYTKLDLTGHFLSLIEKTDPHGTCSKVFENRPHMKSYREITLNTGLSHGFIYKGYDAWINPVFDWWSGALFR
jgi:hypothetical protein